jgi:tRNA threonylcarbamoyladenosine biosynthesis protein TsaB
VSVSGTPEHEPLTLALDAATYVGTVAVVSGRTVLAEADVAMRGADEERLMPAVAEVIRAAGIGPGDLARVVCGAGPGSFTSLRIAASIGKGIATGRALPLLAVSSLTLVVAGARPALPEGSYLAVLDAMRGDWFGADVDVLDGGRIVERAGWRLFTADALAARTRGATVVGPDGFGDRRPHARGVAALGVQPVAVDQDTWEPEYGRKAEAQVRWEAAHGRPLAAG